MTQFNQDNNNYYGTQNNIQIILQNFLQNNEELCKALEKLNDPNQSISVASAYLVERKVKTFDVHVLMLPPSPEQMQIPGKFKTPNVYVFMDFASVKFSLKSKSKNIKKVSLIYSKNDDSEAIENIESLLHNLEFERLIKTSKSGYQVFKSNVNLTYESFKDIKIKNYLVLVEGVKDDFDLFIIQTFQRPLTYYFQLYEVTETKELKDRRLVSNGLTKKKTSLKRSMENRIIKFDNLEGMTEDFVLPSGQSIPVGKETIIFKKFVEELYNAYDLNVIDLDD